MQESRKCVARPRDATVVRPMPLYNLYALHISSPWTSLVDLLLIVLLSFFAQMMIALLQPVVLRKIPARKAGAITTATDL